MSFTATISKEICYFVKVIYIRKKDKHCGVFVADNTALVIIRHLLQSDLCWPLFSAAVIRDSQKKLKVSLDVCVKAKIKINKNALARKSKAIKKAKKAINIKVNLA